MIETNEMSEIDRRLASLSPEQREVLMRKLRERGGEAAIPAVRERPRIPEGPVDRFAPVQPTDFQEVLWLGRSGIFDLGGCGSNVYIELEVPGLVWPFAASLNEGLRDVIARHEMLRTVMLPDGRLQLLAEVPPYEVEVEDLSGMSEARIDERLARVRDELRYARRPLDRWPLFTLVLHQVKDSKIRLHARFEAAVIDGTGRSVLIHELAMRINLPDQELPPVDVSFLDYARALAAFRETATYARSRSYWMSRLPSLPPPPILPLARPLAPDTVPRIVKRQPEVLDPVSWQALSRRARRAGLSPTSAVTAAFADVLRLWSARPDFTVGFGGAYQPDIHPHMVRAVGTFTIIHLLALQDDPGTFLERARLLQSRVTADLDHQEFSGHQVWRAYNRLHRTGARALLPIHFNSVVEYGHATPAEETGTAAEDAEDAADRPLQLIFDEVELMISLPQALILWVANENSRGGLELVSQAVEEVFPEGFVLDLIEAYRDLVVRLAAGDAAWNEQRPARRTGTWEAPEPWLADLAGALGYGAHPRFIESALERHPAVRQAAAWRSEGVESRGPLTAWIVCDGRPPANEELRRHLRATLPEHLVPEAFVRVERLPRATDGTIDRAALPVPSEPYAGSDGPAKPWGEIETGLATLWEEVLGRRPAAATDDFFALGGDSLSAVRLFHRIAARWGGQVVPGELFARPTLAGHAAAVRRSLTLARPSASERIVGAFSGLWQAGRRLLVPPAALQEGTGARTGASFGLRIYLILWVGQTLSNLGTSLGAFSLGVWMFQTTRSTTMFAGMMLSATLTALLMAPIAGSITDRIDRRKVLLFANVSSGLITLVMAAAFYTGQMKPWYGYVIASVMTGLGIFQGSAFVASASMLLPRSMLVRTSSMSQTAATITSMLGPLLAGILVARISYHGVILIDTATFTLATLSVLIVRIPRPAAAAGRGRGHLLHDAKLGWNYISERPGLLRLLILFAAANFSVGIVQALLTPLILSFATPQELGAVESAGAFGLLLGGLGLIIWGGPRNRILGILGAFLAQALILLLGGLQPNVPLVTLAVFAFMLASPVIASSSQAIWQSKVALDLQGRVFAIRSVIATAAMPLAFALAGPLADRVFEPLMAPGGALAGTFGALIGVGRGRGVGLLFIVLGLFILLVVLLSALSPRLWKIESEIPDAVSDPEETPDQPIGVGP